MKHTRLAVLGLASSQAGSTLTVSKFASSGLLVDLTRTRVDSSRSRDTAACVLVDTFVHIKDRRVPPFIRPYTLLIRVRDEDRQPLATPLTTKHPLKPRTPRPRLSSHHHQSYRQSVLWAAMSLTANSPENDAMQHVSTAPIINDCESLNDIPRRLMRGKHYRHHAICSSNMHCV